MILSQYMSLQTFEKAVECDGFWVKASAPFELNDPYECTGCVVGTPTKTFIDEFFDARKDYLASYNRYKYIPGITKPVESTKESVVQQILQRMLRDRNFLGQGYRLSFFAGQNHDETLMWAYYGDGSKGVRIDVDISEMAGINLVKVDYVDAPFHMDMSMIEKISDLCKPFDQIVRRKYDSWGKEDEYRVVFDDPANSVVKKCEELNIFRWLIPNERVVRIVLGCECMKESRQIQMKRILLNSHFDFNKFYSAVNKCDAYSYEYIPCAESIAELKGGIVYA